MFSKTAFRITKAQDHAMDMVVSDATHCALGGGSRSGKTFLLLLVVLLRAMKSSNSRHAIFRFRFNAIKSSIILDTLPKVLKLCFPDAPPLSSMLNKTDWYMVLPNGSEIWFGGLDDKDRTEKILGMEFATIYFNECSQIPWGSVVLALTRLAQKTENLSLKAFYDFNPPSKQHWTYLRFVRKINPDNKLPEKDEFNFGFYLINPVDNTDNLDKKYLDMLDSLPEKARNRFLLGKFSDDSDGSLWSDELISQNRKGGADIPEMLRIIIAIDPSGCSGPEDFRSDEVGIVVAGLGTDSHGYLIEDLSGRHGPEQWADIANEAFTRHKADRVVAEGNYGGAMVEAVLKAKNANLPFTMVTATRGKIVRAEPISALYEQKKIHHIGYFPEIEDQLCSMTMGGYQGLKSPDRADACLAPDTIIRTCRGLIPIQHVMITDSVLTRSGYYPLTFAGVTSESSPIFSVCFSDGSVLNGTGNHPVLVGDLWKPIDALVCGDIITHVNESTGVKACLKKLVSTGGVTEGIRKVMTKVSSDTMSALMRVGIVHYIGILGSIITARYQKVAISTTLTMFSTTIRLKIWSAAHQRNMPQDTGLNVPMSKESTLEESGALRLNGMVHLKVWHGIKHKVLHHGVIVKKMLKALARNAVVKLLGISKASDSVQGSVCSQRKEGVINTRLKSIAQCVIRYSGRTSTGISQSHVPVSVVRVIENGTSRVYNLHVDGPHEYYANGVLVHNCVWAFTELFPGMTRKAVDENWRPPQVNVQSRSASRFDSKTTRRRF